MKSSVFKKFSVVFLVLAILISASACGTSNTAGTETTAGQAAATAATQAASTAAATPDKYGKYDKEVTLTSVKMSNSSFKYPAGQDVNDNMWIREMKDKLNINVKYNWSTDESQYVAKLNVSIASGDIPDFFMCKPDQFMNLAKADQLSDLTEAYGKYASADLKATMDAFPDGFNSSKINNKMMALSIQGFGILGSHQYLWIRDDWMKKLNLQAPKTMADVEKIALAFMDKKPDGQENTFGISVRKDFYSSTHSIIGFANGYHAYPNMWINDKSGSIVYGSILPEMKNALAGLQAWYKKGIISTEFGVSDGSKADQDFINGKVGIIAGASWWDMAAPLSLLKKNPEAIVKPYELPSADGTPTSVSVGWPVTDYNVVSKSCKNPEAVIKMASLYMDYTLNSTLENYRKFFVAENADEYYKMSPVYTFDPRSSERDFKNMNEALDTGDEKVLLPAQISKYSLMKKWKDSKDPSGYGAYFQTSKEGSVAIGKKMMDEDRYIISALRGAVPPKYASVKVTLDKLEIETFTKIIMGEADPDTEFTKFVDSWKKLGGDDATKEVNDTFGKK